PMPELPDVELYLHALGSRIVGRTIERVRLASPFLVRSFDPPVSAIEGRSVAGLHRLGKRIVWELDDELFVVIHLMIAGRFRWKPPGAAVPGKIGLAAFDFANGTVLLTEASPKKRASLHVVRGRAALKAHDPGGLEVLAATGAQFAERLRLENHTVKRALTDPRLFSGIGNAYSDEILHAARLSPLQWTSRLSDDDVARLFDATIRVLRTWTERLARETGDLFPEKVTAFREDMAVHGRYGRPCPECGSTVQRIRYADNECNYCATCQTRGKLLADRSLSRLLGADWPKTLEELERLKA
ncbi:MAG TPA: DNA-formamidopyrimidine glycosylase family protein, partial [Woeseiaceae bacterium]|nr:DNA-formamidopyrimidine glycosylase family protein [Woeseiaceae bacterium]